MRQRPRDQRQCGESPPRGNNLDAAAQSDTDENPLLSVENVSLMFNDVSFSSVLGS